MREIAKKEKLSDQEIAICLARAKKSQLEQTDDGNLFGQILLHFIFLAHPPIAHMQPF